MSSDLSDWINSYYPLIRFPKEEFEKFKGGETIDLSKIRRCKKKDEEFRRNRKKGRT